MINIVQSVRSCRQEPLLRFFNRRVVNVFITPAWFACAVVVELRLASVDSAYIPWVAAAAAVLLGWIWTRWQTLIALFWVDFHRTVFDEARKLRTDAARRRWFGLVRRWMEINELNGRQANRLFYSRDDRDDLAWTYDAVVRRASGDDDSSLERQPAELRERAQELHDRIEEIPRIGTLLFYLHHWRLVLVTRTFGFFLVLSAVPVIVTMDFAKTPPERRSSQLPQRQQALPLERAKS